MSNAVSADPQASPDTVYREGLAAGELRFQHCDDCDSTVFYPRVLCPACGSQRLSWRRSEGRGTVYATTSVRGRSGVSNVALVDLDEGFRLMSRVEDVPADQVVVGSKVTFGVVHEDDTPIAVFRSTEGSR